VKQGDLMFKIDPALARSKLEAENAEAELAQREYDNTKRLAEIQGPNAPQKEVALAKAKLDKAIARRELAKADLNFANLKAPFAGIIGRPQVQPGEMVKEGDTLTTLSDNSVMWVYYKISEKDYLDYMANQKQLEEDRLELVLADQTRYPHPGKFGALESQIHNETGNIAFRADFPNPDGLLRHGQSGTILIRRKLHDVIVVPQRATFEITDKRYVYVVDKDDVVHRREIVVQNEMDDIYVIKKGVDVGDRIILEGIGQVRDGEKVEFEFRSPEEVIRGPVDKAG
jgi:membrane fusion protein (multidrug efflux system)